MKLLTWKGRLDRLPYFLMGLATFILFNVFVLFTLYLPSKISDEYSLLIIAIYFSFIYIGICSIIKRLHDIGYSGVRSLLFLVPLYNIYFSFLLLFKKGESSQNKYGYGSNNKI